MTRKSCAVGMRNAILRNHLAFLFMLLLQHLNINDDAAAAAVAVDDDDDDDVSDH